MNYEKLESEFEFYSAIITIQETFQEIYEIMGADIGAIGRNITSVIDATKKLTDIAIKTQNLELQESVLELRNQLVDIKTSLVEVREENLELREDNKKLKEQLESVEKPKIADQLICKDRLWFVATDEHQVPVCRNCTEETNRFVYMSKSDITPTGVISGKNYKCPKCKDSILVHDEIEIGQYFIS